MKDFVRVSCLAAILALGAVAIGGPSFAEEAKEEAVEETHLNDYPTFNRADYVYGCMQVNGNTREALEKCSCSIDVIASILPFKKYEEAETVMSLRLRGGESVQQMFHPIMKVKVDNLKRAQVEGELKCF